MNVGLFPLLKRYKTFKHDWEPAMLEGSHDLVFRNSFKDIRYALETLNATGTRYEFECYDTSHLYNLASFRDEGLIAAPFFIQTCFGLLGGIGSHPDDVMHMKRTADRLFGDSYRWSVLAAGQAQMRTAAMAAALGGHVRVGQGDSLWLDRGELAQSNAAQVGGPADHRRARADGRDARGCSADPRAEGRRPGRLLIQPATRLPSLRRQAFKTAVPANRPPLAIYGANQETALL